LPENIQLVYCQNNPIIDKTVQNSNYQVYY
jgi:hypothetical protein